MNMRWVVMRGTSHHKFQTWKASSLSRLDYPHLFIEVITARSVHAFVTFNYLSFYCVGETKANMPGLWIWWWWHSSRRHCGFSFWTSSCFPGLLCYAMLGRALSAGHDLITRRHLRRWTNSACLWFPFHTEAEKQWMRLNLSKSLLCAALRK